MTSPKGLLFIASGPSGTGKTTLCRMVQERLNIPHVVSYTTRAPRKNEVNGDDYHFVDLKTFQKMITQGELLEWAQVHGNFYGTPAGVIRQASQAGQNLILDLDTQGAQTIKAKDPHAILIFIDVADNQVLADRLGRRGTEDPERMQKRLNQADLERKAKDQYDYKIVNEDLEKAYTELLSVISQESKKRSRMP